MTRSPRVVELLGLPGAGKTTIMAHLRARPVAGTNPPLLLVPRGGHSDVPGATQSRAGPVQRMLAGVTAGLARPVTAVAAGRLAAHAMDDVRERARRSLLFLAYLARFDRMMRQLPSGARFVLIEEGLLQMLVTLPVPLHGGASPDIGPLVRRTTARRVHAVVHLDVPIDVARTRLRQRPTNLSRFDTWPDEDVDAQLRRLARMVAEAVDLMRQEGLACLALDAAAPTAETAERITAWLRELGGAHGAGVG